MATFTTSQQWLEQSTLLVEARPQTPKPARRVKKSKSATADNNDETLPDAAAAPKAASSSSHGQNPRAKLVVKAVDPVSGVCLRYATTKAAEVSRLVQLLGQLAHRQAGLAATAATAEATKAADAAGDEHSKEDVAMTDAEPSAQTAPQQQHHTQQKPQRQQGQGQSGGGGGKGKKKKGKR